MCGVEGDFGGVWGEDAEEVGGAPSAGALAGRDTGNRAGIGVSFGGAQGARRESV